MANCWSIAEGTCGISRHIVDDVPELQKGFEFCASSLYLMGFTAIFCCSEWVNPQALTLSSRVPGPLVRPKDIAVAQRRICEKWSANRTDRKTEILLRVIRNFLFSLMLYVCKLHGPKPSVHVDFSSFTCNQMPVHHWKKETLPLAEVKLCLHHSVFVWAKLTVARPRLWPCFFTCPSTEMWRETSNTKHLCRCVLASWYFEDQSVPSLSNWPMQLQPVDPARNSGRKLEYLHSWVLFCNYNYQNVERAFRLRRLLAEIPQELDQPEHFSPPKLLCKSSQRHWLPAMWRSGRWHAIAEVQLELSSAGWVPDGQVSAKFSIMVPIGSMVLLYMVTFTINIPHCC